jgi:hypothetical protein
MLTVLCRPHIGAICMDDTVVIFRLVNDVNVMGFSRFKDIFGFYFFKMMD